MTEIFKLIPVETKHLRKIKNYDNNVHCLVRFEPVTLNQTKKIIRLLKNNKINKQILIYVINILLQFNQTN